MEVWQRSLGLCEVWSLGNKISFCMDVNKNAGWLGILDLTLKLATVIDKGAGYILYSDFRLFHPQSGSSGSDSMFFSSFRLSHSATSIFSPSAQNLPNAKRPSQSKRADADSRGASRRRTEVLWLDLSVSVELILVQTDDHLHTLSIRNFASGLSLCKAFC